MSTPKRQPGLPADRLRALIDVAAEQIMARHAEQTWLALGVVAGNAAPLGRREAIATMMRSYGVHLELARAAVARPILPSDSSDEAVLGRDILAETMTDGQRKRARDFAQKVVGETGNWLKTIKELRIKRTRLELLGKNKGKEWERVLIDARSAERQLATAHEVYFRLAEEIDARRAEFDIGAAFDQVVKAQLHVNAARDSVASAKKELEKIPEADVDAATSALIRLLDTEKKLQDEIAAAGALLPKLAPVK